MQTKHTKRSKRREKEERHLPLEVESKSRIKISKRYSKIVGKDSSRIGDVLCVKLHFVFKNFQYKRKPKVQRSIS